MRKFIIAGFCLSALVLLTGCPSNQYEVDLTPHGKVIERKLLFYREDGVNSNGVPNYQKFSPLELAEILQSYSKNDLKRDGLRYTVSNMFNGQMPHDVGGSGSYTNVTTSLGSAGFYLERFRGDDDLATRTTKRLRAADQLTDFVIGWSRMELGRERGYQNLRKFLDTDFRRDVRNLSLYAWMLQTSSVTRSQSPEEFAVRYGQYLAERGYLKMEDLPELFRAFTDNDSRPLMKRVRRLVAYKLGVSPNAPSLAFLADADRMTKSWESYLMTTDAYRVKYWHWQKEKIVHEVRVAERRVQGFYDPTTRTNSVPAAPDKPDPEEVVNELCNDWVAINLFDTFDHVTVRLSLPVAPTHSNGKWDEARKQVVWESDLEQADKDGRVPAFCFANWAVPDAAVQKQHFGRVLLSGDELSAYCLWRGGLDKKEADEWDAFIAGLQGGDGLKEKIDAFRFSSEFFQRASTAQQQSASLSEYGRKLLLEALEKAQGDKK